MRKFVFWREELEAKKALLVAIATFESKFVCKSLFFGISEAVFLISNECDFEAEMEKNKKIHVFAIKCQKTLESMPNTKHEIFGRMVFTLAPFTLIPHAKPSPASQGKAVKALGSAHCHFTYSRFAREER